MNLPAANHLPSTPAFLVELQRRIVGLRWQNQPAFERVEIFSLVNLQAALASLIMNQARICVVVYAGDDFSFERRGMDLHVTAKHSVVCLISDESLQEPLVSHLGDSTTPGVHELQRLVLGVVCGNLLPNPHGAFCVPLNSSSLVIAQDGAAMPGRAALELDLEITGGEILTRIGAGPIL